MTRSCYATKFTLNNLDRNGEDHQIYVSGKGHKKSPHHIYHHIKKVSWEMQHIAEAYWYVIIHYSPMSRCFLLQFNIPYYEDYKYQGPPPAVRTAISVENLSLTPL